MKIVHSWLLDLCPGLPDDTEAIAEALSDLGLAVESVDRVGASVAGVVTAKVLRTERHPNAAKVHRVYVDAGDGVERHVWCGAFNMSAGDVVPLATAGTAMPDGRLIEPKPILGIPSQGMLCSARELGLGDDHSGILLLPHDIALGVPYGEALGLREELVYDLDVLRNRPDAYGHLGVARDLAARFGVPFDYSPPAVLATGAPMTATVELDLGMLRGSESIKWVPVRAVQADSALQPRVWVLDPQSMTVSSREVAIGRMSSDLIEVTSGLTGGEEIVAVGAPYLSEGMKVTRMKVAEQAVPRASDPS